MNKALIFLFLAFILIQSASSASIDSFTRQLDRVILLLEQIEKNTRRN